MASRSSGVRFLGIFEQQQQQLPQQNNTTSNPPLELDESDVVWSSSSTYSTDSDTRSPPHITASYPISTSHTQIRRHRSQLNPYKNGLSAALSVEHHTPFVLRKSALNPSISAASAAKTIPPVFRSENSNSSSTSNGGRMFHQSAPVNVPVWPNNRKKGGEFGSNSYKLDEVEDEAVEDEEEMVPPHVIVARSHMTRSVFEGVGRTLKGRDLCRVRNAVFQKTGFLD